MQNYNKNEQPQTTQIKLVADDTSPTLQNGKRNHNGHKLCRTIRRISERKLNNNLDGL